MGWSSGDEVFDPVCRVVIAAVDRREIHPEIATQTLTALIKGLQSRGWDTEGESLAEFRGHEFVVAAFKAQGVELPEEWFE